jgi:hypothetical protein
MVLLRWNNEIIYSQHLHFDVTAERRGMIYQYQAVVLVTAGAGTGVTRSHIIFLLERKRLQRSYWDRRSLTFKTIIMNILANTKLYPKRIEPLNLGPREDSLKTKTESKISWHCPFNNKKSKWELISALLYFIQKAFKIVWRFLKKCLLLHYPGIVTQK